jgi:hypothetical protein
VIRTRSIPAAIACAVAALPGAAQEVVDCDWRTQAANLPEPWESPGVTRTFANGEVRLAVLDTVEPAAAAFYLMILSPPRDELGGRQCRIVGGGGDLGFAGLSLEGMEARYDPARGLVFSVPVRVMREDGTFRDTVLTVSVNQATGAVAASLG